MMTTESPSLLVAQSCEDTATDAGAYEREFIAAVKEAQAEISRGDFITFEEFEKELDSWVTK